MTYIKHNSAKASKLRGMPIGGGGVSLTPPGASRAHQQRTRGIPRCGQPPRASSGSVVLASFMRRGKRGENPKIGDVLDIRTADKSPVYELTATGSIRKVVA